MGKNKQKKKHKKKTFITPGVKLFLIILLIPISVTVYSIVFLTWENLRPIIQSFSHSETEKLQAEFDLQIPEEYIPIYISAAETYNIPWTLLAAHHRVETRFSTMKSFISPVGAEGHLQVRP